MQWKQIFVAFFVGYLGRVFTEKAPQVTIVSSPAPADFGFGTITIFFLVVIGSIFYYYYRKIT